MQVYSFKGHQLVHQTCESRGKKEKKTYLILFCVNCVLNIKQQKGIIGMSVY